jgi:hypothetical protein
MSAASQLGSGSTFSFTLPLFSLAKLLLPIITFQGRLRDSIVLVRVELTPLANSLGGSWKETCQRCLELLRRCIFVDKDLVLPSTGGSGPGETFFVVASTDMAHVDIMMERIRAQVLALPRLQASSTLRVTAEKIYCPASDDLRSDDLKSDDPRSVEERVAGVAACVTEIIQHSLKSKPNINQKETHENAN